MKVLIASPVRQKPAILREFLAGLEGLETEGLEVDFSFVNDNDNNESSDLLRGLVHHYGYPKASLNPNLSFSYDYICDENTHHWNNCLVDKVSRYKDSFIRLAVNKKYDYLFLVDSDLVLHPQTLKHLVSLGKNIVSEIFWTRWHPGEEPLPNVWMTGNYSMTNEFLQQLKTPGTYPVGGLGACTLISRRALEAGVSFSLVPNLDYTGEDRHFCVRAVSLGLELWADTTYPAYHIYRESELAGLALWKDRQRERGSKITVGMLVRNEAGRYLEQLLWNICYITDRVVIIDDASTDNTADLCRTTLNVAIGYNEFVGINTVNRRYTLKTWEMLVNTEHCFSNEVEIRKQLWEKCTEDNPDWILILDADELLEPRALEEISCLAADPEAEAWTFRLYDMWDADHYRDDALWSAHRRPWALMVRHIPGMEYKWLEQPLHCGRFPANVLDGLNVKRSDLRIKHMGYARENDRKEKYDRYAKLDPQGQWGVKAQYDSILDPSPTLRPWEDIEHKPTISLCMIVKDEEKNLPRCLESVRGMVDEIIIVDTGSEDNTRKIASEYSAKVYWYNWNNDFAEVRNYSLGCATGDWILFLDADEELAPSGRQILRDLVNNAPPEVEGYFVTVVNRVGDGTETNKDVIFRLFRNKKEYRFEGAIHEQITESILKANNGRPCFGWATGLEILHYGYTTEEIERKKKAGRNLEMFENNPPAEGDLLHHYHYGVELMRAQRLDDAIRELIAAAHGIDRGQIYFPKLVRYLVMALKESGRPEHALGLVRLGTRLWPEYADLWYFGGEICQQAGQVNEAVKYFRRVLETPEQPPQYSTFEGIRGYRSLYQLGQIAEQYGRVSEARRWYERALTDCPAYDDARQALVRLEGAEESFAGLSDWDILSIYLSTLQAEGAVDVVAEDGRAWRGLTADRMGRVIEGRVSDFG